MAINLIEEIIVEPTQFESRKIKLISRYKINMLKIAEITTIKKKLKLIDDNKDFKEAFVEVYPDYYKYLKNSIEREVLVKKINEYTENLEVTRNDINFMCETLDEEAIKEFKFKISDNREYTKKEFDKFFKRVYSLNRRITRKYKYRLRPSYFDNYLVNDWIAYYNKFKNQAFLNLIICQVDEIIIRQVKRLKLYQFGTPMDDLLQEIRVACLTALRKFDLSKGKTGREAFNYFSLITIKAGRMVTLKHTERFKQESPDTDIVNDILSNSVSNKYQIESSSMYGEEDILTNFYSYYYSLFERKERMQLLLQIMIHYILVANNFSFKKNEFVKYAKSHGFTGAFINKFLNIVRFHKSKFVLDIS